MILVLSQSGEKGKNRLISNDCITLIKHHLNGYDDHWSPKYHNFNDVEIQEVLPHANSIVMVVPEWNSSIPYTLKKMIDESEWPSSLKGTDIYLIGTSGGHGGNMLGLSHLTDVLSYVGANVHPTRIYFHNINDDVKKDKFVKVQTELLSDLMKDLCSTYLKD